MNKSKLSMASLISGITATSLGVILFPLSIAMGKSEGGVMFIGFIGISIIFVGLLGTIFAMTKRLSTENTPENEKDIAIANKGFWFSIIPALVWVFITIIGSIK
jgi:steroid 5-alpha reductase family enzyme